MIGEAIGRWLVRRRRSKLLGRAARYLYAPGCSLFMEYTQSRCGACGGLLVWTPRWSGHVRLVECMSCGRDYAFTNIPPPR